MLGPVELLLRSGVRRCSPYGTGAPAQRDPTRRMMVRRLDEQFHFSVTAHVLVNREVSNRPTIWRIDDFRLEFASDLEFAWGHAGPEEVSLSCNFERFTAEFQLFLHLVLKEQILKTGSILFGWAQLARSIIGGKLLLFSRKFQWSRRCLQMRSSYMKSNDMTMQRGMHA